MKNMREVSYFRYCVKADEKVSTGFFRKIYPKLFKRHICNSQLLDLYFVLVVYVVTFKLILNKILKISNMYI